ncbi:hypothetical protein Phum_PHUM329920 [Pediculus humanus corporis]|uniref:Uncharacterized protein n=1 Tax=Pediculus humanus subsp. corporis TaxID=121224 RepID=E0VN69_PEDHC|nr:uncharacterized protein Phum_PHUM329920 [Pediculus humanus corporis]EEB14825.1 hypothetical protein Phum_PHUM329920 [Pediculus humanus corporis]
MTEIMCKVFQASFFLIIIWARIDYGSAINISTSSHNHEVDVIKTPYSKNLSSIDGHNEELREEKENVLDATIRNFLPIKELTAQHVGATI